MTDPTNVVSFVLARERIKKRRGQAEALHFRILPDGSLEIDHTTPNGAVGGQFGCDPKTARTLLDRLSRDLRKIEHEQYFQKHPEARPKPAVEPKWRNCRVYDSTFMGRGRRCKRRAGHEGPHRRKGGVEFAHTCVKAHQERQSSGVVVRCSCGRVVG